LVLLTVGPAAQHFGDFIYLAIDIALALLLWHLACESLLQHYIAFYQTGVTKHNSIEK